MSVSCPSTSSRKRAGEAVARLQAAEDEQQPPLVLRGQLQAPQLRRFAPGQPGQHGRHLGATQRLFGGPQPGGGFFRANPQQRLDRQTLRLQAGPKGSWGAPTSTTGPVCLSHRLHQRRQHQLPDMLPGPLLQHLDHAAHRPAAAGQLCIQGGMTRRQHRSFSRKVFPPPDIRQ